MWNCSRIWIFTGTYLERIHWNAIFTPFTLLTWNYTIPRIPFYNIWATISVATALNSILHNLVRYDVIIPDSNYCWSVKKVTNMLHMHTQWYFARFPRTPFFRRLTTSQWLNLRHLWLKFKYRESRLLVLYLRSLWFYQRNI